MKMAPTATSAAAAASALASHHNHHSVRQFEVTEDTPVDYLEGCMEVLVIFPNEKSIPMSIQRRMPMLDLLIHVTAANKLSPAAHLLQVTDEDGRVLPQKPSTPIGSLNAHKVYIVPKNRLTAADRFGNAGAASRPSYQAKTVTHFEPTFRVQVRLPRNQLFVTRATGRTPLADLLGTVCTEKELDPSHYEFRHPVNQDERLKLSATLDDYKLTQVVLAHVPISDRGQQQQQQQRHRPGAPSTSPGADDRAMNNNNNNKKSTTTTLSGSMAQLRTKTGLKAAASEASLGGGGEKKKRGLLGLLGFGKHKKGSSLGDSSVSSDSAGERSISPTRCDEPPAPEAAPPPAPAAAAAARPPSPVLVSKRLAEEAVAKRNSRLLMNQKSAEAAAAALGIPAALAPEEATLTNATPASNGSVKAPPGSAPARTGGKKRMAPPPPAAVAPSAARVNGLAKAESEVSTYTTCSSGSSSVSPPVSVVDAAFHRETTPSPDPTQKRSTSSRTSKEGSPVRGQASNLLSTPHVSSTNLTAVSSTSSASLSSVVKKRKAPAPPPVVKEQPAEIAHVARNDDAASSASDESARSEASASSRKSRSPAPAAPVEQVAQVRRRVSSSSGSPSTRQPSPDCTKKQGNPPKPAPRTVPAMKSNHQQRASSSSLSSSVSSIRDNRNNNESRLSFDVGDDLSLDDETLVMFARHGPLEHDSQNDDDDGDATRLEQQLALAARQNAELLSELEQVERTSEAKPRKGRGKHDESPEIRLERWSSSSEDDEPGKAGDPAYLMATTDERSRANSVDTEFFSLSEGEEKQAKDRAANSRASPIIWQPRLSDGSDRSDPDADFAAMCEALARRRQEKARLESAALPSDLSQVPVELLQSLPPPALHGEPLDHSPDGSPRSGSRKRTWRRSNSEPGWAIEDDSMTPTSPPPPPSARSVDNLDEMRKQPLAPADGTFLALNDSSFSSALSKRGDGIALEGPAVLYRQQELDSSVRSSSPSEASEHRGAHSDVDDDENYDVVRPRNQNANEMDGERSGSRAESRAEPIEEHIEPEALYSMVIKSSHGVRVVDLNEQSCDSPTNQSEARRRRDEESDTNVVTDDRVDETPRVDTAVEDEVNLDETPEVERRADVDERADSPVLWEYKLPAPPTPFADAGDGSPLVEKLSIESDSMSNRSRSSSSISIDSLQELDLKPVEHDEPDRVAVDDNKVTLDRGNELLGESLTDDAKEQTDEPVDPVPFVAVTQEEEPVTTGPAEVVAVVLNEEPREETNSDESLPSIVPPLPLTLPPEVGDGDELLIAEPIEPPPWYAEAERDRCDSHSSSSASSHPSAPPTADIAPSVANEAESSPLVNKEPDVDANEPVTVRQEPTTGGSVGANAAPAFLPLMNADFIQQFQAALNTISDPQARALQEEFLRLQQQFLTWQLHAAVAQQQQHTAASVQPVDMAGVVHQTSEPTAVEEQNKQDEQEAPPPPPPPPVAQSQEQPPEVAVSRNETPEVPAQMQAPADKATSSDESSDEAEEPVVYRYAGPPQVKLDTWKPGRPRSEVIDYSSTPSFNIPTFNGSAESKIGTSFSMGPAPTSRPSSASPTPATGGGQPGGSLTAQRASVVVVNKAPNDDARKDVKSPIAHETVPPSEAVAKPKKEDGQVKQEPPTNAEKPVEVKSVESGRETDQASTGVRDKVGKFESNIDKSAVLRKSSFVTSARPFEARPVSMPIRRPTFAPAVIQPVPFVSRKMQRAPEVRGFASLPSPGEHDAAAAVVVREPGPTPFGVSKARPVSAASKENPTIVIRSKLLESARRPSAELDTPPVQSEVNNEPAIRSTPEPGERPPLAARPSTMPVSSSLIMAAAESSAKKEATPTPPPPAPSAPAKRPMASRFERRIDPREELLNSIRNFGANGGSLRKVSH